MCLPLHVHTWEEGDRELAGGQLSLGPGSPPPPFTPDPETSLVLIKHWSPSKAYAQLSSGLYGRKVPLPLPPTHLGTFLLRGWRPQALSRGSMGETPHPAWEDWGR